MASDTEIPTPRFRQKNGLVISDMKIPFLRHSKVICHVSILSSSPEMQTNIEFYFRIKSPYIAKVAYTCSV